MRFSKAPLIATLMAVALSLLVILPALAENTDGQVTQGRTLNDELIVGVFANPADSQPGDVAAAPLKLGTVKANLTPAYMLGDADPRDTFFDGKLYVSNQGKAFNTVLVTHLSADGTTTPCVSVAIKNENTGESIALSLVPTNDTKSGVSPRYFQNYFKVVDRDADPSEVKSDGKYICTDTVAYAADSTVSVADDDLARINASDGDRLTITVGSRIQEIYVDGVAPVVSETTPADGSRFASTALRLEFEVRDEGSGLRHDGENVMSSDGDPVLHDAANPANLGAGVPPTDPRVGDNDGITDREPISNRRGGSQDITVSFKLGAFDTLEETGKQKAYRLSKAARVAATTATGAAVAGAPDARTAAGDKDAGATKASVDAMAAAQNAAAGSDKTALNRISSELSDAATALEVAAGVLQDTAKTTPVDLLAASEAADLAVSDMTNADEDKHTGAKVVADKYRATTTTDGDAQTALTDGVAALDAAADALVAASALLKDASQRLASATALEETAATFGEEDTPRTGAPVMDGTPIDDHGSSGWVQIVRGVAYEANIVYNVSDHGDETKSYQWRVSATDRVGNEKTTKDAFDLTIDTVGPKVTEARTGISYSVSKSEEVRDTSSIALTFTNAQSDVEDPIDVSTLDNGDFIVEGFEVMDIIHPEVIDDDGKDADGNYKVTAKAIDSGSAFTDAAARDPRSRVYLQLNAKLGSAETPRIQILGGAVRDLAGNSNSPPQAITPTDKIPAGLTITVTSSGSASGRPVAAEDETFTVAVEADEPLKRRPELYFVTFGVTGKAADNTGGIEDGNEIKYTLPSGLNVSPVNSNKAKPLKPVERDREWTGDYDADLGAFDGDNVFAVLVWSSDTEGNAGGSTGWTDKGTATEPDPNDTLSLAKLDDAGLLIEIDRGIEEAEVELLPSVSALVTESTNSYLQLTFSESAENTAALTFAGVAEDPDTEAIELVEAVAASFTSLKDGSDTTNLDAHKTVTLTTALLNDVDVSSLVGPGMSTSGDVFTVALRGLDAGMHTFTYSAVDEASNEVTKDIDFEVKAHAAYKVPIRPGWNLISFPGTPADNSIGDVMGAELDSTIVLGYQYGAWVSAIRNDAGEWQGTLEDIVGGYGYWVQTTVFETISAVIPPADPTDVLPSVPVISGWNLLGVVDIDQAVAGNPPIGKAEADDYFVSIDWRVGYYFENEMNDWKKIIPKAGDADEILNGKGYWIWATGPGKLVP